MVDEMVNLWTKKREKQNCQQPTGRKTGNQQLDRQGFFLFRQSGIEVSHVGYLRYWIR
jgi:hypothetical protein